MQQSQVLFSAGLRTINLWSPSKSIAASLTDNWPLSWSELLHPHRLSRVALNKMCYVIQHFSCCSRTRELLLPCCVRSCKVWTQSGFQSSSTIAVQSFSFRNPLNDWLFSIYIPLVPTSTPFPVQVVPFPSCDVLIIGLCQPIPKGLAREPWLAETTCRQKWPFLL